MRRAGYSLYFVTPQNPGGAWFDMTPGPHEISETVQSNNQIIPLPGGRRYLGRNGEGIGMVEIAGTFGVQVRQFQGQSLSGEGVLKLFRELLDQYLKATENRDPQIHTKARVEWHDWEMDRHYLVEPIKPFSLSRGRQNKIHYLYSMRMEVYGEVKRKLVNQKIPVQQIAQKALKDLRRMREALQGAARIMTAAREKAESTLDTFITRPISELQRGLEDFVSGATRWVEFPLSTVNNVCNKIHTFVASIANLGSEPVVTLAMQLRQAQRVLRKLQTTPELFKATFEQAAEEFASATREPLNATDTATTRDAKLEGFNLDSIQKAFEIASVSAQSARKRQVMSGDTLQSIALRELGDSNRWKEISLLNGYLDNDELANVSEILIPDNGDAGGDVGQRLATTDFATVEARLYGRDLFLDTSGRKVSVVFTSNDLATVEGVPNLLQAVTMSERVRQGTLLRDADYGIRAVIGSSQSTQNAEALAWSLRETSERDPRVQKVEVSVEVEGNHTRYDRTVYPVGTTGPVAAGATVGG